MSDGKEYEKFVQDLQQALLDSDAFNEHKNIQIERNKKIKDAYGIEREFDLYWEYELAGITYKTVIECKDYASRVSIDRIDALIGKIRDIPDIKPVFATRTGYQRGAEEKARHNRIDLLIVREQTDGDWTAEDGTPLVREVHIDIRCKSPPRITAFRPFVDEAWLLENTAYSKGNPLPQMAGLNIEIFIEDLDKGEKYSLFELAPQLDVKGADGYGDFTYREEMPNAFLNSKDLRVKLRAYEVDYRRIEPYAIKQVLDFSKELLGVIDYLHKGSSTAIFKNKIVKDWKKN